MEGVANARWHGCMRLVMNERASMWHGEGVIRDCEALKKNHVENQHRTAGNDLFS